MSLLFETIRVSEGQMEHLPFHEARIAWSLDENRAEEIGGYLRSIALPIEGLYKLKAIYDRERFSYEIAPYRPREISSLKIIHTSIEYPKKFLDRGEIDALFAKRGSMDEVLFVRDGALMDTSIHNIALLLDGIWWTPKKPLLKGTTRERLLRSGKLEERRLCIKDLERAQNIALMNAMVGFMEIGKVEIEDACDRG